MSAGITTAIVLACWFGRIVFREVVHIVPGTRVKKRADTVHGGRFDDTIPNHRLYHGEDG